jgi:ribosomal protein S27AE
MSTKPMKPLPKQQVQVDLKDADTMKCQKCGNSIFIQGYVIKRISAIVSPTGKEVIAPIQVFNCGNCGEMLPLQELDELI